MPKWYVPLAERLEKYSIPEPNSGCLLWFGGQALGYGLLKKEGTRKMVKAHRVAWELDNGPVPEGLFVLHRCDTRCCINTDHLFLGTLSDNMRDCVAKGRDGWSTGKR
jgi:hypothetical protein